MNYETNVEKNDNKKRPYKKGTYAICIKFLSYLNEYTNQTCSNPKLNKDQ